MRQVFEAEKGALACKITRFCLLPLMPRLKAINKQKLYRPETGMSYSNLEKIMATKRINWELAEEQLDVMVKHAVALKLGMTDAESLLRRFTRKNAQHSAYKGFSEIGKAIKTIFLCRYLASEELRREINAGLNVVETWNGTTTSSFSAKAESWLQIGKRIRKWDCSACTFSNPVLFSSTR